MTKRRCVPKGASRDERAALLGERLGIPMPSKGAATELDRWWADIGMRLAEEQPEFRPGPGRPASLRATDEDRRAVVTAVLRARRNRQGFNHALREVVREFENRGMLPVPEDRTTNPKRLRRLKKRIDQRLPRIWDLLRPDEK